MRTRVVVLFGYGQYSSVYLPSKEEASKYIEDWEKIAIENNGRSPPDIQSRVIRAVDESGATVSAFSQQYIIGMYMPDDSIETCQEKIAKAAVEMAEAAKKQTNDGEGWKG